MSSLILGATLIPATTTFAATNENQGVTDYQLTNKETLSDNDISLANNYIVFNESSQQFDLSPNALESIDNEKYAILENILEQTNFQINEAKNDPLVNVLIETPQGEEISLNNKSSNIMVAARGAGKTDIKFYWNYARIWLSASTLRSAVRVGVTVGSVYAPAKIVQAALALAGLYDFNFIKIGIWMDYNYFAQQIIKVGIQ